jgi:TraK protein
MMKMHSSVYLALVFAAWAHHVSAVVFHEIDTTLPAKCSFSNTNQNRIVVENGRIEKVIFTDDSITVRMEEESGQAFVCAFKPITIETVVSVVTDKGEVQDLEISFEKRSSEVVVLKSSKSKKNTIEDRNIVKIIDQILSGQTPDGYCCKEGRGDWYCIENGFKASTIAEFESSRDMIRMVTIINASKNENRLSESQLGSLDTQWVYLIKKTLSCQERTIALVSERKQL